MNEERNPAMPETAAANETPAVMMEESHCDPHRRTYHLRSPLDWPQPHLREYLRERLSQIPGVEYVYTAERYSLEIVKARLWEWSEIDPHALAVIALAQAPQRWPNLNPPDTGPNQGDAASE